MKRYHLIHSILQEASAARSQKRCFNITAAIHTGSGEDVLDKSGWLSRLMKARDGQSSTTAHSSILSDKDFVYELSTHQVKPANIEEYLSTYEQYVDALKAKRLPIVLVGSWNVQFGNQDEMIHLWKYEKGYLGTDEVLAAVQNDGDLRVLRTDQARLCRKRENNLMLAFSYWGDPKPKSSKNVYEMRSYVLKAGTMFEWGSSWAKGINHRRDFNQDFGGFFTQVGRLYVVYHFWAYESLSKRRQIREETWRKPGWDKNVLDTVPLIRKMKSKILVPNKFSPTM